MYFNPRSVARLGDPPCDDPAPHDAPPAGLLGLDPYAGWRPGCPYLTSSRKRGSPASPSRSGSIAARAAVKAGRIAIAFSK